MAGPEEIRQPQAPSAQPTLEEVQRQIRDLTRDEARLLNAKGVDIRVRDRQLAEIKRKLAEFRQQEQQLMRGQAIDASPAPIEQPVISDSPPALVPGDELPRRLPEVGDDNGTELEGVKKHEQQLREATEFLGAGLHFFAQDVLGMEFDNSFSSALFTNDAYLRQQMEARGLTSEEISTVQRASAAYTNASQLIDSEKPASEWVVEGGVDIPERCHIYATVLSDLTRKHAHREQAPTPASPGTPPSPTGEMPHFDYGVFSERPAGDDGFQSADRPGGLDYLDVPGAPTPGAPAATWNSDDVLTTPLDPLRGSGSPRRGVRETVRDSLRGSKGEKFSARLDALGVDLVERYRREFERRARPEGEAIMQRDLDRGRALEEAESRPVFGWTRRDTDMYIVALGGKKLQHEVNEVLGKFLDGILGGNLKKAVMDSYRAYRSLGKAQLLELPKGYEDVYKRGEAIIEAYHKRLRDQKISSEVEGKLDPEERQKLDAAGLSESERVLYLKIRARKIPFPKKPSEFKVFSKVWGIRDIRKIASSRQVQVENRQPEAQKSKEAPLVVPPLTDMNRKLLMMAVARGELSQEYYDTFVAMWNRDADKGVIVADVEKEAVRAVIDVVI